MGQPAEPYYQEKFPIPKRDVAKAKALLKEAGVTTPITLDFMVPNGAETRAVAEVVQSMAAEAGFDLKIRVTEFATSLKEAEDGNFQVYLIGWSGRSDPDGNSYSSRPAAQPQNNGQLLRQGSRRGACRGAHEERSGRAQEGLREVAAKSSSTEGSIIYLYHPQVLVAHTDKLEGYKQMPDGLVRVIGLKLK